ncbi:MAG: 50S ribosomal protein L11 methyltransferase [Parachlamydiales bacterium]|nr:50S ribosomal protein L11 methyltransferase [Parachlamydiales bacterium]
MPHLCCLLETGYKEEDALEELKRQGLQNPYSLSDPSTGEVKLYGEMDKLPFAKELKSIKEISEIGTPFIDWENQWETFSPGYNNGYLYINLFEQELIDHPAPALKLLPGPGFGDLSHPTTRLMMQMMKGMVQGKTVIDIGCGSGILSIVALACGAKKVIGIDIDNDALEHAQSNAELNGLNSIVWTEPEDFVFNASESNEYLFLINMIPSEQTVAWNSLKQLHQLPGHFLVSGILEQNRSKYLQECVDRYGEYISEIEEECWSAFHFCK